MAPDETVEDDKPSHIDGELFPLSGVRIVDFCSNIAGPFATMILAQLGADVVKVEGPGGDDSRSYAAQIGGESVVHQYMSVGKRGVCIDLKTEAGLEVARKLIATADVVLQSMRPGVAKRLGIGREDVAKLNGEALYYDVNAYGTGPIGRGLPGYDPLVQAFVGIMEMTGHEGSPPTRCAPSVVDLGAGQWVAMGVLAALLARAQGQPVGTMETALVDSAFSLVGYQATSAVVTGRRPPRSGSGNPIAAPYQCYRAKDGYLLLAAPSQRLWQGVLRAIDSPALAADERFRTISDRTRNRAALEGVLNEVLAAAEIDEWIHRFGQEGVPVGRVHGLEEAVVDPVAQERGTFMPSGGMPLVRLPWLADGKPVPWRQPAPRLGQHSREVMRELGYDGASIDDLITGGAVVVDNP